MKLKTAILAVAWTTAIASFGRLRYYWVQHEVAWAPEARFWQYLLPAALILTIALLCCGSQS